MVSLFKYLSLKLEVGDMLLGGLLLLLAYYYS